MDNTGYNERIALIESLLDFYKHYAEWWIHDRYRKADTDQWKTTWENKYQVRAQELDEIIDNLKQQGKTDVQDFLSSIRDKISWNIQESENLIEAEYQQNPEVSKTFPEQKVIQLFENSGFEDLLKKYLGKRVGKNYTPEALIKLFNYHLFKEFLWTDAKKTILSRVELVNRNINKYYEDIAGLCKEENTRKYLLDSNTSQFIENLGINECSKYLKKIEEQIEIFMHIIRNTGSFAESEEFTREEYIELTNTENLIKFSKLVDEKIRNLYPILEETLINAKESIFKIRSEITEPKVGQIASFKFKSIIITTSLIIILLMYLIFLIYYGYTVGLFEEKSYK